MSDNTGIYVPCNGTVDEIQSPHCISILLKKGAPGDIFAPITGEVQYYHGKCKEAIFQRLHVPNAYLALCFYCGDWSISVVWATDELLKSKMLNDAMKKIVVSGGAQVVAGQRIGENLLEAQRVYITMHKVWVDSSWTPNLRVASGDEVFGGKTMLSRMLPVSSCGCLVV